MKTIKMIILLSLFASTFFTLYAQDNSKLRVAVFDPSSSGTTIDEGTKMAVRELISSTFVNTGKYIIVERSLLDRIMREQEFSNSGAVDDSQATEVGKLAGANKVIMSVVTLVGGRNMLSIKIIDVQTATIDQQKTKIVNSNDLLDIVEPLTAELLGEKAPEPAQNTVKRNAPSENFTPVPATNDDNLIKAASNIITQACKQPQNYNTDEERFNSLKTKAKISLEHFIATNSKFPVEPTAVNDGEIIFFLRNRNSLRTQWAAYIPLKVDDALLLFLDGKLIGFGMASTGFLVTLPKSKLEGQHNLSFYACTFHILSLPNVLFTENYYVFDWVDNKKIEQKKVELVNVVNEKDGKTTLSSPNSYEIAGSVSNLIFDAIKDSKKSGKYKNDEERFANLKDRGQIADYIVSITTDVAGFPDEDSNKITFYCKKDEGKETALLLFLDGKCTGIGTKNKGLLSKIPVAQFTGMHTVSLWNSEKELLNIPVDFSFKTYYPFEWNRNTLALATATATATANTSGEANAAVSSVNSYDVSGSVSELILRAITEQEPKKHDRYKTDEERFDVLKNKKQITDYIGSVTANAVPSKEDSETAVFFCEGATGNDLNVLLFLDGRCIGAGTKNRGMFTKIPKIDGIHKFSLWCDDKKVLDLPVNFSFKSYYLFEWKRNNISLKN